MKYRLYVLDTLKNGYDVKARFPLSHNYIKWPCADLVLTYPITYLDNWSSLRRFRTFSIGGGDTRGIFITGLHLTNQTLCCFSCLHGLNRHHLIRFLNFRQANTRKVDFINLKLGWGPLIVFFILDTGEEKNNPKLINNSTQYAKHLDM